MLKKRKTKLWKSEKEAEDEDREENMLNENFETDPKYYSKRKVLKTWGFYNERFKQAWETFVGKSESTHISALYLGTVIFVEIICRYITRKYSKVGLQSTQNEDEGPEKDKNGTVNSGMRITDKGSDLNQTDYIFRKRKGGRVASSSEALQMDSGVEKYNLRIKSRLEKKPMPQQESDLYDDYDDYSPERLRTTRATRALTKKLNKS